MKRILSLVLVAVMVAAMLCACAPAAPNTTNKTPATNAPATNAPTQAPTQGQPAGNVNVNVHDYLADDSAWDIDAPDMAIFENGKLTFDTNFPGEFCAAMLKQPVLDGSYKFTLTVTGQPEDANSDEVFWETELFIIARAAKPGPTWDSGEQTGYCISSWGDLSTFCLGRAGADDAFGVDIPWSINDGQPHEIEISTENIEKDGKTAVKVIVKVDGEVAAEAIDEGQNGREGRPTMYPEGGNLVIRAKWMEIVVG